MSKTINIYSLTDGADGEGVIVEYEDFKVAEIYTDYGIPEDNTASRLKLAEAFKEVAELGGADFVRLHHMTYEQYEKRYEDE